MNARKALRYQLQFMLEGLDRLDALIEHPDQADEAGLIPLGICFETAAEIAAFISEAVEDLCVANDVPEKPHEWLDVVSEHIESHGVSPDMSAVAPQLRDYIL